jgi:hypothetical protein
METQAEELTEASFAQTQLSGGLGVRIMGERGLLCLES